MANDVDGHEYAVAEMTAGIAGVLIIFVHYRAFQVCLPRVSLFLIVHVDDISDLLGFLALSSRIDMIDSFGLRHYLVAFPYYTNTLSRCPSSQCRSSHCGFTFGTLSR